MSNMTRMSLYEFSSYIQDVSKRFVYNTDLQPSDNSDNNSFSRIKVESVYDKVIVTLAPNRVCFRNTYGSICINMVKYVYVTDNLDCKVFDFVCKSNISSSDEDVRIRIKAE